MRKIGNLILQIICIFFLTAAMSSHAQEVCLQYNRLGKCISFGNPPAPSKQQNNNQSCGSPNPKPICAQSYNNWIYQKEASTPNNVILKCIHNGKYVATCVTTPIDSSTIQTSNPDTPNGPTALYGATLYQSRVACTEYYYWCNPNLSSSGGVHIKLKFKRIPIVP